MTPVEAATASRQGWFLTFRSDPNAIELFGALLKAVIAVLLFMAVQDVVRAQGAIPSNIRPGSLALLGQYAYSICVLLWVHAVVQTFAVVNNVRRLRIAAAVVSLLWWGFFISVTVEAQGVRDLRTLLFVMMWLFKCWVIWRLVVSRQPED